MLLSLLTSSLARILYLLWSDIALFLIMTYGVRMSFSKYEWFSLKSSICQASKSNVGTFPSLNSSGISVVNTKSGLIAFIAGWQILFILLLLLSCSVSFSILSSSSAPMLHLNSILTMSNLIPILSTVVPCLTSSTYELSRAILRLALVSIILYCSPQSCITTRARHIVILAPIGPPSVCLYVFPANL